MAVIPRDPGDPDGEIGGDGGGLVKLLEVQVRMEATLEAISSTLEDMRGDIASLGSGKDLGSSKDGERKKDVAASSDAENLIKSTTSAACLSNSASELEQQSSQAMVAQPSFFKGSSSMARMPTETHKSVTTFVAHTLPLAWPRSLPRRKLCVTDLQSISGQESNATTGGFRRAVALSLDYTESQLEGFKATMSKRHKGARFCKLPYVDPSSNFRMIFDCLSLVILCYDLTMIPIILAFDLEPFNSPLKYGAWTTMMFWTFDLMLTFVTGSYRSDGELVRDHREIAMKYLRSWFTLDLIVVVSDWVSMVLRLRGIQGMLRMAKLGRLMRVLGMIRMLRFVRLVEELLEASLSEGQRLGIRIFTILVGILGLTHVLCCAWLFVGLNEMAGDWSDTGDRWVDYPKTMDGRPFTDPALRPYQYLTSFHWAVSQLTLGSIEIACTNAAERFYNVICLLTGLLFGSALISSLSAAMVELQAMKKDQTLKLRVVRRYLRENLVEPQIAGLVQRQITRRLNEHDYLTEHEVPALKLLSSSLRGNLRAAIMTPFMITQPLFRFFWRVDEQLARQVAMEAAEMFFLRSGDELFVPGASTNFAYYLAVGGIKYTQDPATSAVEAMMVKHVAEGTWLSFAAMWCEWIHVGTAVATSYSKLMKVKAEAIQPIVLKHRMLSEITLQYGRSFQDRIACATPPSSNWPNDLEVPFTEFGDIMLSMPKDSQVAIGISSLEILEEQHGRKRWGARQKAVQKLEQEVNSGKTILMETGKGNIERVVSVIALRIEDTLGGTYEQIFAQIGKDEDGVRSPAVQLPGVKLERGEMTKDAVLRLLNSKLPDISDLVVIGRVEREVTEKESKEYGVNTKYLRTICHATLTDDFSMRPWKVADNAKAKVEPMLREKEVFVVESGPGKLAFYAWLDSFEFDQFGSPSSEQVVHDWLEGLVDPEQRRAESARSSVRSSISSWYKGFPGNSQDPSRNASRRPSCDQIEEEERVSDKKIGMGGIAEPYTSDQVTQEGRASEKKPVDYTVIAKSV